MASRNDVDLPMSRVLRDETNARPLAGTTASRERRTHGRLIPTATSLLMAVSLIALGWGEACEQPLAAGSTASLSVKVTGLGGGISNGGSVSVVPSGGGPTVTVNLPAGGTASAQGLPVGSYQVTYTPPAGYVLASGVTNPQTVQLAAGQTTTVSFQAVSAGSGTGVITVDVTGLLAGVLNGGSATVTRTDVPLPPVMVPIPATGSASASGLAAGTYQVLYAPLAGYGLALGDTNPQTVHLATGQTQTATFPVVVAVAGSFGNIYEFGFEDGTIGQFNILPGAPATYQVISSDFLLGSHSILIDYPANQGDEGVGLQYISSNFSGQTYNDIWCRFAMKQLLSVAAQDKKIIRFSGSTPISPTFVWSMIYDPSNDYYTSWFETFAGSHGLVPMTNGPKMSQILGQWHWWEVHLALNYNSAPVHVDVFYDRTLIYSQDASAAAGYSGTNTQISKWNYIEMDGTLNGGPNAHEQTGFDQIGIGTVQMGVPIKTSTP